MSNINIIPQCNVLKILVGLVFRSFIYYVINVHIPRVRANAYHTLTTPPRVFRDSPYASSCHREDNDFLAFASFITLHMLYVFRSRYIDPKFS